MRAVRFAFPVTLLMLAAAPAELVAQDASSYAQPPHTISTDDNRDSSLGTCAGDMRGAITFARQALREDSGEFDRIALGCLIEAVAMLGDKVQGLSEGSVAFDGPIHIPKGFVIVKPDPREGD